uniref:Uncharacterized protein n=1 Tax=Globodera rostochiensis TaxID=31243 RepID=A0A914IF59_GLORO
MVVVVVESFCWRGHHRLWMEMMMIHLFHLSKLIWLHKYDRHVPCRPLGLPERLHVLKPVGITTEPGNKTLTASNSSLDPEQRTAPNCHRNSGSDRKRLQALEQGTHQLLKLNSVCPFPLTLFVLMMVSLMTAFVGKDGSPRFFRSLFTLLGTLNVAQVIYKRFCERDSTTENAKNLKLLAVPTGINIAALRRSWC